MDEADEQPSNEYAQADDDDDDGNNNGKRRGIRCGCGENEDEDDGGTRDEMANASDDEDFTYSYGDVLSAGGPAAVAAVAAGSAGGGSDTATVTIVGGAPPPPPPPQPSPLVDAVGIMANKPVEEVKLETAETIICKPSSFGPGLVDQQLNDFMPPATPSAVAASSVVVSGGDVALLNSTLLDNRPNSTTNSTTFEVIKLNIHRLPGKSICILRLTNAKLFDPSISIFSFSIK